MATYLCRTRDASGAVVDKTVAAGSEREALLSLEASGLVPIRIRSADRSAAAAEQGRTATADDFDLSEARRPERLRPKQLQQFSMQLGSSLAAGVPVLGALRSIGGATTNKSLSAILAQMVEDIEGGLPVSASMRRFPRAFPEVYVSTIAAGERTGGLDDVLFHLCDYLEAEIELRSQVRSALMYPAIVVGTLCLAVSILVIFIVPRFATFYSGMGAELPLPTRILLGGTSFVRENGLVVAATLAASAFALTRWLRTATGKGLLDRALLRIPVLGRMIESTITVRVVQMLGVTVNAGIPLLEGLQLMANTTRNTRYRRALAQVVESIGHGETLSDSLEAANCFPPSSRQMLASGEATGAMVPACEALTRHLQRELKGLTKDLATLIEPLLTVVLAAIVLFVALAAFLPMWDMTKVMS